MSFRMLHVDYLIREKSAFEMFARDVLLSSIMLYIHIFVYVLYFVSFSLSSRTFFGHLPFVYFVS